MTNKKSEITSSSGMYRTIYHNGSYLLLFGMRKGSCEVSCVNDYSDFEISTSLF